MEEPAPISQKSRHVGADVAPFPSVSIASQCQVSDSTTRLFCCMLAKYRVCRSYITFEPIFIPLLCTVKLLNLWKMISKPLFWLASSSTVKELEGRTTIYIGHSTELRPRSARHVLKGRRRKDDSCAIGRQELLCRWLALPYHVMYHVLSHASIVSPVALVSTVTVSCRTIKDTTLRLKVNKLNCHCLDMGTTSPSFPF